MSIYTKFRSPSISRSCLKVYNWLDVFQKTNVSNLNSSWGASLCSEGPIFRRSYVPSFLVRASIRGLVRPSVRLFQLASGEVSLTILMSNIDGEYHKVF